ncbi:MAG: Stp1/IreP family PP2C-type Ser/Thr phosphatase [Pseudomonadota bacterium]
MKFHYAALTDPGMKRDNNEDNCLVIPEQGLFVVSDGMGGHNAGEVASQLALDAVKEEAEKFPVPSSSRPWWKRIFFKPKNTFNPVEWIHQAVRNANSVILREARADPGKKGMGATLALVLKRDEALLTAHVGDSRVYRFRRGRLEQLTQDHSLAQELVRQGIMTEEEAMYSAPSNVLTRALGVRETVQEDIIYHSVEKGDSFLLCSDGLYNMLDDDDLVKVLGDARLSIQDKARRLVDQANENGGDDNITVVLAYFD